jgi:ribonuclease H / adenosylcobalamin/alpha-ribazole phosphatase
LIRQLPAVRFTHIRRELNTHADRLANQAMDDQAAGRAWQPRTADAAPPPKPAGNSLYGWSAPVGSPTVAMLLRHGETPLSAEKRFSGRGDTALSRRGEAQAAAAAERLVDAGIEQIVSSPLRRTHQTATVVADRLGLDIEVEEGFAETDFGAWEGSTFAEISEHSAAQLRTWLDDPTVAPPGGESMAATAVRVSAARERIMSAYPAKTVLIVSHVTPIKLTLRAALDAPMNAVYRLHLDPASLSIVDWQASGSSVVRLVNDISHLGELATTLRR